MLPIFALIKHIYAQFQSFSYVIKKQVIETGSAVTEAS